MSVVVVRPYGRRIRERVFALLAGAGFDMERAGVIAKGTSDDDVIVQLRRSRARALLIPFHAHRDSQGEVLNGLELAQRIAAECPALAQVPIFMPISAMGMGSATLMLSREGDADAMSESLRRRILLLPEDELDSAQTRARVAAHARGAFATTENG